jgi:polynucleotide 5'-hydroxyl-kinase GRC3/NOL9
MSEEQTTSEEYAEWEPTLTAIVAEGGSTLIMGGTDVGKTTFARLLTNRLIASGRRVGVVDADLGQSEIGPPCCIGMAVADTHVLSLSDLTPRSLAFVGATSPPGYLIEHAIGVRRMADLAAPHPLVVDTSGFITGATARRLGQSEFELLQPEHLVALQRGDELEAMLAPLRRRSNCHLHTPPIPAVIGKKPAAFRIQRRAMRFAAYFQEAAMHTYPLSEITIVGSWLGNGVAVAPHLLRFLDQCLGPNVRVYYAEQLDRHLGLMVSREIPVSAASVGVAQQELRAKSVSITVAPRLKHLLVGLEGASGKLLGLGLLEAMDFRRGTLGVLTPVRAPAAARVLRLGGARITPEGTEVGALRPGEVQ